MTVSVRRLFLGLLLAQVSGCAPVWMSHNQGPPVALTVDSTFVDIELERKRERLFLSARWRHLRALDEMQAREFESAQRELDKAFFILATLEESDHGEVQLATDELPQTPSVSDPFGEDFDQLAEAVEGTYFALLPHLETLSPDSPVSVLLQGLSEERIENLLPDASQIVRIHQLAPKCDIPIDTNARVAASIHFFRSKGRETYISWMHRSGKYRDLILNILQQEGVPQDFLHLAMIESGFNPRAYSRAKAVGLWQFMLHTGRLNGLRRTHWLDERRDPLKSTRAAARHLKDLFEYFGDWRLAAAAYNSGKGRVSRAIDKAGSRDFWKLELPKETRNYVPLLMATTVIAKNPSLFGFDKLTFAKPDKLEQVRVSEEVHLPTAARLLGIDYQQLREYNPELRRQWTPLGTTYFLRVPAGSGAALLQSYARLPDSQKPRVDEYVVRNGDNISIIAKTFAVSTRMISDANGLRNPNLIHPGQRLFIPLRGIPSDRRSTANVDAMSVHTVRPGESLSAIAHHYRVSIAGLKRWNKMRSDLIHPGDKLRLELPALRTRARTQPVLTSKQIMVHQVQKGDTLWELSRHYDVELADLIAWNELTESTIKPGQKLVIGPNVDSGFELYTVIQGDTLYSIARRFGTDMRAIARHNNMSPSTTLLTGMTLRVPFSRIE